MALDEPDTAGRCSTFAIDLSVDQRDFGFVPEATDRYVHPLVITSLTIVPATTGRGI